MQRAGAELKRARAAISHVPESEQSRALEVRVLTQLFVAGDGYGFETPEYANLLDRMAALGQQAPSQETADDDPGKMMPDAARYDALYGRGVPALLEAGTLQGILRYVPLTQAALSQSYVAMVETVSCHQEVSQRACTIGNMLKCSVYYLWAY